MIASGGHSLIIDWIALYELEAEEEEERQRTAGNTTSIA